jgi:tRNA 5-methylaminomethyl-2-thiouridine biosynthesis bifunctional protein
MSRALDPAEPVLSPDGTPYSPRYDDVYHSVEGGLAQARHVFLGGNGLPQAWQGREQFVIVETGFGQGLNFLATWQAWRDDPRRCGRLHVVSVEKHPFTREGLATVHAGLEELAPLAAQLQAAWPLPLPGLHRMAFDQGAVVLTLALGDVDALLPKLALGADAFYLDGFSPARNADMWAPIVMKRLARLARPGATLATYTAAGFVRRGLASAGFEVAKAPGFASKRDMTVARFPSDWPRRRHPPQAAAQWPERHAIVVGAGLAGCAVTERLTARGWRVSLFEAAEGPARVTSAHRAAAMHPHLSADDALLSRLSRAGNLYSRRVWQALAEAGHPVGWDECGVLQLGADDADSGLQQAALSMLGFPTEFARWMSAEEAAEVHGAAVPRGGLWFGQGGWVAPPDICRAQLAMAGDRVEARFGCRIAAIERDGDGWIARDEMGTLLARAPVVVLANAHDAARLMPQRFLTMRRVRGQLTTLLPEHLETLGRWPDCVVTGTGYLLPADAQGAARIGSSYEEREGPLEERAEVHAENLERLANMLPAAAPALRQIDPASLSGYVGERTVSHHRLPWVGRIADEAQALRHAAALRGAQFRDVPRLPGVYAALAFGSRGLTWAALAAELVASQIEGEPLPLESDLVDALDPARLLVRALRHGKAGDAAAACPDREGNAAASGAPRGLGAKTAGTE